MSLRFGGNAASRGVLGRGEVKSRLTVEAHGASKPAIAAVEKAGGTVKILALARKEEAAA